MPQPKKPPSKPQARRRTREGSSEVGGVLSARRRSKTKGRARFKRAQGLGAHTPLPHAAHSLSLECPSQRNRHPSPRLAAERAREALKSVVCFRRAGVDQKEGESSLQARPRPRRSHPATPRGPQPQPRVPQPKKPPSKPQARRRTREGSSEVGGVLSARRRSKTKGRARFKRAQGLGAHTPLPHAAHSLSLECPSQRNRHPSPRLAAERAREALKSVVCFRRAGVRKRRGELASKRAQGLGAHTPLPHAAHSLSLECPSQRNRHLSPRLAAERAREALKSVVCFRRAGVDHEGEARFKRAQGLSAHTPLSHAPTASASSAPAKETAIQAPGSPQNARGKL